MMGEFIIYFRDNIIGGSYDDRLLVKPIKIAIAYIAAVSYEMPVTKSKK